MSGEIIHPANCPTCHTPLHRFVQEIRMVGHRLYMAECQHLGCPHWMRTFTYHIERDVDFDPKEKAA